MYIICICGCFIGVTVYMYVHMYLEAKGQHGCHSSGMLFTLLCVCVWAYFPLLWYTLVICIWKLNVDTQCLPWSIFPYILKDSFEEEFVCSASLANEISPRIPLWPPSTRITGRLPHCLAFCMGDGNPNPGLNTHRASALLPLLSLQPLTMLFWENVPHWLGAS